MQFDVVTIFPDFFDSFLSMSLIKKAIDKNLFDFNVHNLRDYTFDKHKTVDDTPYGGGAGMVMKVEPIVAALKDIKKDKTKKTKVILFSPAGVQFNQKMVEEFSRLDQLVMISGRYEGIDARVEEFIDEKVSVGPYVLSGGELPTMIVTESVARLLPGYMGNEDSLKEETFSGNEGEYPQYTKPEVVEIDGTEYKVPEVLLSGNHREIAKWRKKNTKKSK